MFPFPPSLVTNSKSLADWVVSLQSRQLMPDPHSELGSQDTVVISASESLVPLHDITALRFLLRQPSPNWKTFSIEDIAVLHHGRMISRNISKTKYHPPPPKKTGLQPPFAAQVCALRHGSPKPGRLGIKICHLKNK